jgi:hypothetical protein
MDKAVIDALLEKGYRIYGYRSRGDSPRSTNGNALNTPPSRPKAAYSRAWLRTLMRAIFLSGELAAAAAYSSLAWSPIPQVAVSQRLRTAVGGGGRTVAKTQTDRDGKLAAGSKRADAYALKLVTLGTLGVALRDSRGSPSWTRR